MCSSLLMYKVSSKACWYRERGLVLMLGLWLVERGEKVGHVGWMTSWGGWGLVERGEKSAMLDFDVMGDAQIRGSCQSKWRKPEVKCQIFYYFILPTKKGKSAWASLLQAGTWARTECHGGRPICDFLCGKKCHAFVWRNVTHLFGEMSHQCHANVFGENVTEETTSMHRSPLSTRRF